MLNYTVLVIDAHGGVFVFLMKYRLLTALAFLVLPVIAIAKPFAWRQVNPGPTSAGFFQIIRTGSNLVAISGCDTATSTDGANWVPHHVIDPDAGLGCMWTVAYNGKQFVGAGNGVGFAWVSSDGIKWDHIPLGFAAIIQKLIWTGSEYAGLATLCTGPKQTRIMVTSPDGLKWAYNPISVAGLSLWDITWTGKKFVAVGTRTKPIDSAMGLANFFMQKRVLPDKPNAPTSAWSLDGRSWQSSELPANAGISDIPKFVLWTGSRVVSVGMKGSVFTSSDGESWIPQPHGVDGMLVDNVVWTGRELIALGATPDREQHPTLQISRDGESWARHDLIPSPSVPLAAAAWMGSQYVVTGMAGLIQTSPDGVAWTVRSPIGPQDNISRVAYNGSVFVAVGDGAAMVSQEGETWVSASVPADFRATGIAWIGSSFAVVCKNGQIFSSIDGRVWNPHPSGVKWSLNDITWTGNLAIAVGDNFGYPTLLTSPDGRNWTRETLPDGTPRLEGVAWSGSEAVAVGDNGWILRSADGHSWQKVRGEDAYTPLLYAVTWTGKMFVAVGVSLGNGNGSALASADGKTWRDLHIQTPINLRRIAWCGDRFIVLADEGDVWTSSSDGNHWTLGVMGGGVNDIIWTGKRAVEVGSGGLVVVSEDTPVGK